MRHSATALRTFLAAAALAAPLPASSQDAVPLRLEFRAGQREDMRFDLEMKTNTELASDAFETKHGMDGRILFTFRNLCKKAGAAGYAFEATFTDLDMSQKVLVNGEKLQVRVRDREVKIEGPDGDVVVDTEKGVNPKLAEPILKEIEGFGVAMDLEMDPRGLVKEPGGDKRLPKLLQGFASSGNLYPFVLPEKPVKPGEEWVYESEVSTLGELKLPGKPIKIPLRYTLERFAGEGASRVAIFSTKVDTELRDLECEGKMEGIGDDVKVKINSLSYRGTGETRFVVSAGRVAASSLDLTLRAEMATESEDLGGALKMKVAVDLKARIAPVAARKRDF